MEKHPSKKRVLLRKGSSSESLHQVTFTSGNSQLSRFCPSLCWLQKSISLRCQKWSCLSILIHVNKAHKRLTDKPQSLWIHFPWKICHQTAWTLAPSSLTNILTFLWPINTSWNPRCGYHTGRSSQINSRLLGEHVRAITVQMPVASNILSPDKCSPISSTTTILVQAAIILLLDKHETLLAIFPASASSLPIYHPQTVQSKHLKIENRSWLSPTSTPLMLCMGLMINTRELTLKPWSGPAHPSSLLHAHSSCHPHISATLVSFYSLKCTDPSTLQRFCTPRFLWLETNAHTLHLPHKAHTCLVICNS